VSTRRCVLYGRVHDMVCVVGAASGERRPGRITCGHVHQTVYSRQVPHTKRCVDVASTTRCLIKTGIRYMVYFAEVAFTKWCLLSKVASEKIPQPSHRKPKTPPVTRNHGLECRVSGFGIDHFDKSPHLRFKRYLAARTPGVFSFECGGKNKSPPGLQGGGV